MEETKVTEIYTVKLECKQCRGESKFQGKESDIKERIFWFKCPNCNGSMREVCREVE